MLSFKNKKANIHSFSSFIYKEITNVVSSLISDLINESFSSGTFPDVFKIAKVIPVHKSGNRLEFSNFRPISTLHHISKVFEKIMYSRMIKFLSKFNILSGMQFGFMNGRSTDVIYEALNDKSFVLSLLLDFSKAFDAVDHPILLQKLEAMGIRGTALDWLSSYLSSRKQYVCINGVI
jgi:hypothetical protein